MRNSGKPTQKETAEEYKDTLQYVLANIEGRKTTPLTCADDECLAKYS